MFEVIRWFSIVLMWIATGMNVYTFVRCNRTWKRYEKKEKELDVERKYFNTMIAACTEFLEAERKKVEEAADGQA